MVPLLPKQGLLALITHTASRLLDRYSRRSANTGLTDPWRHTWRGWCYVSSPPSILLLKVWSEDQGVASPGALWYMQNLHLNKVPRTFVCIKIWEVQFLHISMWVKVTQSCPTLGDPMHCSLPGSSVYGLLQVRILKWGAIPISRGSSWPRDLSHCKHILYCVSHQESP